MARPPPIESDNMSTKTQVSRYSQVKSARDRLKQIHNSQQDSTVLIRKGSLQSWMYDDATGKFYL